MLLVHQVGSVKIGEVVRYTVTYTPSQDRILPSPEKLFVRIRNTSAIALRAAFVHGPYTLSVAAYPSGFDPNEKFENPRRYGIPVFEPMLKAGGSWEAELTVPDNIRQGAGLGAHGGFGKPPQHDVECASWVVEVSSQVIFSTSAAVGYELVVARDKKSLNLSSSLPVVGGQTQAPQPGRVGDYQQSVGAKDGHHPAQPRGIFSRAVHLKIEDTATLWNTPRLPGWDDAGEERVEEEKQGADEPIESMVETGDPETQQEDNPEKKGKPGKQGGKARKQKKIHLVILTHGLHSNLGADMLFMKESIDNAAKKAKVDAKSRRQRERKSRDSDSDTLEEDDDEEVIVRGYSGNATKTERGIKYLGKRLARYVLSMTYPDQGYLPIGKGAGEGFAHNLDEQESEGPPSHKHSTIHSDGHRDRKDKDIHQRPYKITSISFIAHSLGGLTQTYAVAYIQKHSPDFFDLIRPINFICLASPFLGLSNENPLYVKFALDFGLVGRTGKDLGLTWRAPTIARSGWGAIVGNLGETAHKKVYGETQPESKPLLRILPTGPAHTALKKFRNRTVYSNVVNDGIVPLRTSCLLFLDWQGLGRVEKARRDAGLVETMVGFGWAELTGTKIASPRPRQLQSDAVSDSGENTPREGMRQVPQPDDDAVEEDDRTSLRSVSNPTYDEASQSSTEPSTNGPLSGFFNLFKSNDPPKPQPVTAKQKKILRRGQTRAIEDMMSDSDSSRPGKATSGNELEENPDSMMAPPKTTFFESAGDLLNPKVAETDYLIDPSKRPRTIFHDRVYHPSDIPPLPLKKRSSSLIRRKTFNRSTASPQQSGESGASSPYLGINHEDSTKDYDDTANTNPDRLPHEVVDNTNMRVEEKIARGYHRDLSWRKVLVKLEPDAHNNIFVRRMFANAYGWPVMKHLVDVHFSDSPVARASTSQENLGERARPMNQPPDEHGGETRTPPPPSDKTRLPSPVSAVRVTLSPRDDNEAREALDEVPDLPSVQDSDLSGTTAAGGSTLRSRSAERPHVDRADSMAWSDRDWADSDSDRGSTNDGKEEDGKGKDDEGRSSPSWNWTEKIVGKGATHSKTPEQQAEQK